MFRSDKMELSLKETVHPKMNIPSSFTHPPLVPALNERIFLLLNTKEQTVVFYCLRSAVLHSSVVRGSDHGFCGHNSVLQHLHINPRTLSVRHHRAAALQVIINHLVYRDDLIFSHQIRSNSYTSLEALCIMNYKSIHNVTYNALYLSHK